MHIRTASTLGIRYVHNLTSLSAVSQIGCESNTNQADIYSHGQSEKIIAKALKQYNIPRSKIVILSKCYFGVDEADPSRPIAQSMTNDGEMVNEVGLSRKHIFDAVEKSVERLGTYIDVLQIHRLDRSGVPKEEIMKALNDVIEKGWVRYIGASSMAAWEFQMLQNIADRNGWHRFISMQNYYNLVYREEEREMVSIYSLSSHRESLLTFITDPIL